MASTNEEIVSLRNDVSNLSSRLLAVTPNQVVPVVVGQYIIFGCKVTEGVDDTDFTVSLEGQAAGDTANLNPNITANPSRGFEFPNIASTLGGMLATNDVTADVDAAPATGTARYDIAYVFAGKEGAGFAIQTGSPAVATKDDFDTYGLDTSPFGQATITDPDIPSGSLAVARIYVEDVFTGIQDARIADIRDFSGDLTFGGLIATNNLSDVQSATTSATNLGLGTGDSPTFSGLNISGTINGPSGSWDIGGMDIAVGDSYAINSTDVLTATVLGSGVITSSLTTVGALNAGSISSGFGNIDIGASTFDTTGAANTGDLTITGSSNAILSITAGNANNSIIFLGDDLDASVGAIFYDHVADAMTLRVNNSANLVLSSTDLDLAAHLNVNSHDIVLDEGRVVITDTANERALFVTSSATTQNPFQIIASSLTTGNACVIFSNSAATDDRSLALIINDNPLATGTTPLKIQQDAVTETNFKKIADFGAFTLFTSDGTTADGALTGVEGDICLNGGTGAGQMAYCDADGTNWTDM